jgi:hypothetical protein
MVVIKMAGEQEVKAQVKLMLKDIGGDDIIAIRSLVSTQKVIKLRNSFHLSYSSCNILW